MSIDFKYLNRVWDAAAQDTPVFYTGSLPVNYRAVFKSNTNEIYINRPDADGYWRPLESTPEIMRSETTVIAHEMGHAQNKIWEPERFATYMLSLKAWVEVELDGSKLDEIHRLRIFEEEFTAMKRGLVVIEALAPHLSGDFLLQESRNLESYRSILWTGAWLNGTRGVKWPTAPKWPPL